MIKDNIENIKTYFGISERVKMGLEWLKTNDLEKIKDGKYEIDGKDLYVNVQSYETKDDAKYEAHRNYIDIQYMIEGKEQIGVTNYHNCISCINYDSAHDIEFLNNKNKDNWQILNKGEFLILFPQDAHKPSIKYGENKIVKKAVVKVAI